MRKAPTPPPRTTPPAITPISTIGILGIFIPLPRDFDFAAQGGETSAPLPIQRPALGADEEFQGTVQYQTSRGQVAILGYGRDLAAYAPFPPAAAQAGDSYGYGFHATGTNGALGAAVGAGLRPCPVQLN